MAQWAMTLPGKSDIPSLIPETHVVERIFSPPLTHGTCTHTHTYSHKEINIIKNRGGKNEAKTVLRATSCRHPCVRTWVLNTLTDAVPGRPWSGLRHTHTTPLSQPPHRLWPLLVTELIPVKALTHDGVLRAAHDLRDGRGWG